MKIARTYLALILLVLGCSLLVSAQTATTFEQEDAWAFTSESLIMDLRLGNEIRFTTSSSFPELQVVEAELTFVPIQTDFQTVMSFESVPKAKRDGNSLFYTWRDPSPNDVLPYYWKSRVQTSHSLVRVAEKVSFPLDPDDLEGLEEYLTFTENIDVNDDIRALANELAQGEDDLYELVFKVSSWMKDNIEYNLDYAESLEKASLVLETRQGVCDEFTGLFVSLMRSLNIPTKYVSGYAYTNLRTPAGFGPHAWAEVYFPGAGWVPFDMTYNEFGFVDASHIKLKDSFDSGTYSARYEWRGRYVGLQSGDLEFDAEVIEIGPTIDQRVSLEANFLKEKAGFGSYNLVEVEVTNLNNFYEGITVYVTRSDRMEFPDGNSQDVLLKPYETKTLYWVTKLHSDLDDNFRYQIPVRAYLNDGISADAVFTSTSRDPIYLESEVRDVLDYVTARETKVYSNQVKMQCYSESSVIYSGSEIVLDCSVRNAGTIKIDEINICAEDVCKALSLAIAESKEIQFPYYVNRSGQVDVFVKAENEEISDVVKLELDVLDFPKLEITNVTAPLETEYSESFEVSFLLHKIVGSNPKNVSIRLLKKGEEIRAWDVPELTNDRRFIVDYAGHLLSKGRNPFLIQTYFVDEAGNEYTLEQGFGVDLVNVSLIERLYLFAERVSSGKSSFDLLVLIIFAFALGGLIGFLLKGLRKIRLPTLNNIFVGKKKLAPPKHQAELDRALDEALKDDVGSSKKYSESKDDELDLDAPDKKNKKDEESDEDNSTSEEEKKSQDIEDMDDDLDEDGDGVPDKLIKKMGEDFSKKVKKGYDEMDKPKKKK
jgi:hypothetical protein